RGAATDGRLWRHRRRPRDAVDRPDHRVPGVHGPAMKHAGPAALDKLEPLLAQLRILAPLREKSRGVFYLKSRAFLHFHEDPSGLHADIRSPGSDDFERLNVDGPEGRAELVARVSAACGVQS